MILICQSSKIIQVDLYTSAKFELQLTNLLFFPLFTDNEKVSDYSLKLLDLDCEQLGIPVSNLRNTKPLKIFLQHC